MPTTQKEAWQLVMDMNVSMNFCYNFLFKFCGFFCAFITDIVFISLDEMPLIFKSLKDNYIAQEIISHNYLFMLKFEIHYVSKRSQGCWNFHVITYVIISAVFMEFIHIMTLLLVIFQAPHEPYSSCLTGNTLCVPDISRCFILQLSLGMLRSQVDGRLLVIC